MINKEIQLMVDAVNKAALTAVTSHEDGRTNSLMDEDTIKDALVGLADPTKLRSIPDITKGNLNINIKSSSFGSADNAVKSPAILVTAICDLHHSRLSNNQAFDIIESNPLSTTGNYWFLVFNKNTKQCFAREIGQINEFKINPYNGLQIDWGAELSKAAVIRSPEERKQMLLTKWAEYIKKDLKGKCKWLSI